MRLVGFSVAVFALAWLGHWIWWRVAPPRRPFAALLVGLLAVWPLALTIAWKVSALTPFSPQSYWEAVHSAVFYVSFVLAYIVTYSALCEDSATLSILVYVDDAGTAGRPMDQLLTMLDDSMIIGSRFQALIDGGILEAVDDGYMLTSRGRRWALFFQFFRSLYQMRKGG